MEELTSPAQLPNHQQLGFFFFFLKTKSQKWGKTILFLFPSNTGKSDFLFMQLLSYFMHDICAFLTYTLQRKWYSVST